MTDVSCGAIVTTVSTGAQLFVVHSLVKDSIDRERWVLVTKMVDRRGRSAHSRKTVGPGDVRLIKAAPESACVGRR